MYFVKFHVKIEQKTFYLRLVVNLLICLGVYNCTGHSQCCTVPLTTLDLIASYLIKHVVVSKLMTFIWAFILLPILWIVKLLLSNYTGCAFATTSCMYAPLTTFAARQNPSFSEMSRSRPMTSCVRYNETEVTSTNTNEAKRNCYLR